MLQVNQRVVLRVLQKVQKDREFKIQVVATGAAVLAVRSFPRTICTDQTSWTCSSRLSLSFLRLLKPVSAHKHRALHVQLPLDCYLPPSPLQAMRINVFDLILMDIHMPEMDGLQASTLIQQLYAPEDRPRIIAISADTLQVDQHH